MKFAAILLLLTVSFALVGCGRTPTRDIADEPLTIDGWKVLPVDSKYEIGTFERLKLGEPKLQDDREWQLFARSVMLPAKKRELPSAVK